LAQLADVQFFGNRHTLDDIKNILCDFKSLKELRIDMEPYGGIMGRLFVLEQKIDRLEEQVKEQDIKMFDAARTVVREHEENSRHNIALPAATDEQYMIPLIRHEAQNIAEQVVNCKLRNLHLNFNY